MQKPRFNPNLPFSAANEVQQESIAAKPKFDPNKPFESRDESNSDEDEGGILDSIVETGKAIDSYTGAPARASIGALQDGKNPFSAFANQFGEDSDLAPTGKQIAQKLGVTDKSISDAIPSAFTDDPKEAEGFLKFQKGGPADISASGAMGLGIDIAADPTLLMPVGAISKVASKGAIAGAKGLLRAADTSKDIAASAVRAVPGGAKAINAIDKIGDTASVLGKATKEGAKSTASALKQMFTPSVADDYEDLLRVAKKNNIDPNLLPESVEFGEGSFISRASRNRREGVLGEPYLKKFEEGYEAVSDAAGKKIANIGGGYIPSSVEAGELIRKGYDDAVEELFKNVDFTYDSVIKQAPSIRLTDDAARALDSKLTGMEKYAQGLIQRGITKTEKGQAQQILRAVQAARNTNGSLKQLKESMNMIGKHAFKKGQNALTDIPIDQKKFQDMYFAMRDAFINSTASQLGDDVAKSLIESNQIITNFNTDKQVIAQIVGNRNLSPEKVFSALVENGDTARIQALKNILPQETFKRLKGAFLANQVRRNADDVFSFKGFHNNLRNKKNVVGVLLDPEEINDLSEIIKLGSRFGDPVLSTSGTGASSLFRNLGEGLRSGVENDAVLGLLKDSARKRSTGQALADQGLLVPKVVQRKQINPTNMNLRRALPAAGLLRALTLQQKDQGGLVNE